LILKSSYWLLQPEKGDNTDILTFKKVLFCYCFSTIKENGRVIILSELLNERMEKLCRTHLLSSECNHYAYDKAPTLAYPFHELDTEASLAFVNSDIF
jgi:hypothetical protein